LAQVFFAWRLGVRGMASSGALRQHRVALIGSTGGGTATLGHHDPQALVAALGRQLRQVAAQDGGAVITDAVFVACSDSLDSANADAPSSLWVMPPYAQDGGSAQGTQMLYVSHRGSLSSVNKIARNLDEEIAKRVGHLDGVIAISTDAKPGGVNRQMLAAAGAAGLPVAGTGGTSLSIAAAQLGCRLAGNAGGSVATTPLAKAIGIAAAFAGAWGTTYSPDLDDETNFAWHSVLDGCLPAFLATACIAQAATGLQLPERKRLLLCKALKEQVLPPAVGAVVAQQASGLGDVGVLGGAVVGGLSNGSALCALLAGRLFGWAAPRFLVLCLRMSVPATATTLATAGGLASATGLAAHAFAPVVEAAASRVRVFLDLLLVGPTSLPLPFFGSNVHRLPAWVSGGFAGICMNHGSRYGLYHQLFLPLILVEMEHAGMSLLGTLDWLTLCMTGAGACAAQLLVGKKPSANEMEVCDSSLARRGVLFNLAFGDYIEACFPFLERDPYLNYAVYFASGLSGAMVASAGKAVRSSAYLCAPLAVVLGTQPWELTKAAAVAFAVPLAVGVASNVLSGVQTRPIGRRQER